MLRKTRSILFSALGVALVLGMLTPTVKAATPLFSGTLYYTTFSLLSDPLTICPAPAAGCFNVWQVSFTYNSDGTVTLGTPAGIAQLTGADGIKLVNGKLIVSEQGNNKVAMLDPTLPAPVTPVEVASDSTNVNGQAYAMAVNPGKTSLLTFPNDGLGNTDWTSNIITQLALSPFTAGTPLTITGVESSGADATNGLRSGAYDPAGVLHYGDALDASCILPVVPSGSACVGHFGLLTLSPPNANTSRHTVLDLDGVTDVSNALPSHDLEFDTLTGCAILTAGNQLWEVCPSNVAGTWNVVSKVTNSPVGMNIGPVPNWDQTINDGLGHLFGANNDGALIFMDYSGHAAPSYIGDANGGAVGGTGGSAIAVNFLSKSLDDIAFNRQVANGCPATKGFWHLLPKHAWPANVTTVDGVTYNGLANPPTMTIGGVPYSQTDLAPFIVSSASGGNGVVIAGSQLVAAVLNIANGSPEPANVIAAITDINAILTTAGQNLLTTNILTKAQNAALKADGSTLDTYNGSASIIGCVEGTPGT